MPLLQTHMEPNCPASHFLLGLAAKIPRLDAAAARVLD